MEGKERSDALNMNEAHANCQVHVWNKVPPTSCCILKLYSASQSVPGIAEQCTDQAQSPQTT